MHAAPHPDAHSAAFWDGLRRHEVLVQHCGTCGCDFLPHVPACPGCGSRRLSVRPVRGTGTVYSWVGVHRALSADPPVDVPYAIATVDLDTGVSRGSAAPRPGGSVDRIACRMFGRLLPPEAVAIGLAVEPHFIDHDAWAELAFRPRRS